jgi:hypothetical protein
VTRAEWPAALAAAERAIALDPGRERALALACSSAVPQRKLDVAEGYIRRAVAANPGTRATGFSWPRCS